MEINQHGIIFEETGAEGCDLIKPLWQKLNTHHKQRSHNFKERYENMIFEDRIKNIREKAKGGSIHVQLVKVSDTGIYIGYCISTAENGGIGEIDSLYVDDSCRGMGIGETLMQKAIAWLESMNVRTKKIVVAEGNEEVFEFYKKFGFYHMNSQLIQKS